MGRLKTLTPNLVPIGSRLSMPTRSEQDRSRQRAEDQPWRTWSGTARWKRLRRKIWKRDGYVCVATGVALVGNYPAPNSPVADHIIWHKGDPDLFWDEDNLQTLSKAYHDREKQKQEREGL